MPERADRPGPRPWSRCLQALLALALAAGVSACATRGEAARPTPQEEDDDEEGIRPYDRVITAEAESDSGLITVHRIDDELYYEIPTDVVGDELLLVTRIARTATAIGYGGAEAHTQVVRGQRQDDRVLLRLVSYENVAEDSLPIYQAVVNANFEPIVASFPIEAISPDGALVIEVTALFTTDVPMLGLPENEREEYEVRNLDDDRSYIVYAHSYPENVEVRHVLTYEAAEPPSNQSTSTISLEMNQSMLALPADPMRPRLCDDRVGYFNVERTNYGLPTQRAAEQCFITRWELIPSDTAAFLRGELVEPVEPIEYYIDPATPLKWRPYIKAGVEAWNEAFAEAGFRNAIIAKDPPTAAEDPQFSPEDARYSVIRYFPSDIQNAYGPHVHDPRTGEILESDIGWYHNVMNLLRNWYFVQTAAANPEARGVEFADSVMGQLITFVSAHEVGHTLGLPHNMKASAAYPVDSLRTTFVCRMGTAPSIMDYARFNYVAQPGDETCFLPRIGPYDKWAIRWGYRPILEAETPQTEEPILDQWIREVYDDPTYYFGNPSSIDPTSQTEAIGTDAMEASRLGIENLKRVVDNLLVWTYRESEDYEQLEELYQQVLGQWNRYMGHVATNIGGVMQVAKTYGQEGPVFTPVPEETQARALAFLAEQAFQTPAWLVQPDILQRIEAAGVVNRITQAQVRVVDRVLDPQRMQRLVETEALLGDEAYTLGEMMDDLREAVWSELDTGEEIDVYRRGLQRGYLERLAWLMTEEVEPPPEQFRDFIQFTDVDMARSDIRAFARGALVTLEREIQAALPRVSDRSTRLHLQDALERIEDTLDPEEP
ncbi:MAG: zinc-dependent metalloprotease [Longimicrobiales bacterium]